MPEKKENNNALRVMPNSYESERAVLACMLLDNDICTEFLTKVTEDDFYTVAHRKIYQAINELSREGGAPVDVIGVMSRLNRKGELDSVGGATALESLIDSIPSTANSEYYLSLLKRDSMLRTIIRRSNAIIDRAYSDDNVDSVRAFAEAQFFDLGAGTQEGELQHVSGPMAQLIRRLNDIYLHKENSGGLRSGFPNLDALLNGFLPGQIIIVAARPGLGKTAFALNVIGNILKKDPSSVIAMFNLEMSVSELAQRILVNLSGLSMQTLVKGQETSGDWDKIWGVSSMLTPSGLYLDDTVNLSHEDVLHRCRALKKKMGRLDLVVVDYLQLMVNKNGKKNASRQQDVSDISRGMKVIAKELGVPVILLSQMSRDLEKREETDKQKGNATTEPKLSDLRESGAIEQDADVVMFIHRPNNSVDEPIKNVTLIVEKHRNGPTGKLYFRFIGEKMLFQPTNNPGSSFSTPKKPTENADGTQDNSYDDFAYDESDIPPEDDNLPPDE